MPPQRPPSRDSDNSSYSEDSEPQPQGNTHLSPNAPAITTTAPDDEASVLSELQAAIDADPSLRAATPQPRDEWEDYEKLLSQNPEIAKPVPGRKKEYYMSKDKWECGHEGEAKQTDIELESGTSDEESGEMPILINDVRGICPTCMEKWTNLESGGGSSRNPAGVGGSGLPSYDQVQEDGGDSDGGDWKPGRPRSGHQGRETMGWNETLSKEEADTYQEYEFSDEDDDFEEEDSPPNKGKAPRGVKYSHHDDYESEDDDNRPRR